MSAIEYHLAEPTRDLRYLAPGFRNAVEKAMEDCLLNVRPQPFVYETYRSNEMQAIYYTRGRTVIPPRGTVTNAATNLRSWHGYGLAVDVVCSIGDPWGQPEAWFRRVAEIFKKHGCKWGGDWTIKDLPHFQWGLCKPSPSDQARELISTKGVEAVWREVGALEL